MLRAPSPNAATRTRGDLEMDIKLTADRETVDRVFSAMFPDGVSLPAFDTETFCAATIALGGNCAERLRQLAIWQSEAHPLGLDDWPVLAHLYERAASMAPTDLRIPHSRGVSALEVAQTSTHREASSRMFQVARAAFEEALQRDPSCDDSMYLLGLSHYLDQTRDIPEAKPWFTRALAANPAQARARLYLGHCAQDEGDFRGALTEYEQVDEEALLRELPSWHVYRLHEQMGYCHAKLGHREEALRLLDGVLKLYEQAEPDALPDNLIGFPSELIEIATSDLVCELFDRIDRCVRRHGWAFLYAPDLERGRAIKANAVHGS
ncbi:Hypothetical protein A7982_01638 [Minicystis rosea]|nr:Hypothetical protein A7982_01638 [Minicystis rosea]